MKNLLKALFCRFFNSNRIELVIYRPYKLSAITASTTLCLLIMIGIGVSNYTYLRIRCNQIETLATVPNSPTGLHITKINNPSEEDALNKALQNIYTSWSIPFYAIESADSESVSVLEINPDANKHTLKILAQSTDLKAMFDYAKKLKQSNIIKRVVLNSQEIQEDEIQPIVFSLTAYW